jgi:hypothetical protein
MSDDKLSPEMQERVDRILEGSNICRTRLEDPAKTKAESDQEINSNKSKPKHKRS